MAKYVISIVEALQYNTAGGDDVESRK